MVNEIIIGDNPNKGKAKKYLKYSLFCLIPLTIYVLALWLFRFKSEGFEIWVIFMLSAIPYSIFSNKYRILASGLKGEKKTLEAMKSLGNGYTVFINYRFFYEGKETEIDAIAVGKNGVFIIEAKNHNGTIRGKASDDIWVQHKVGQRGGRYKAKMRNPIKQVRFQVFRLSSYLKSININVWVEGKVYFSNKKVRSRIAKTDEVFFKQKELISYIKNYKPRKSLDDRTVAKIVEGLKGHKFNSMELQKAK